MTLDQCLCCSRYEPILGQIYDILDETGFNGSSILDDMQMSYMTLNDFKNLNRVERRSSKFDYSNSLKDEKDIPKNLIDVWNEKNLNKYKEKLKETKSEVEINEILKNVQKSDYSFIMDWSEQEIDIQSPDVKVYPLEGITAKYYVNKTEKADTSNTDSKLDKKLDNDVLKDKNNVELIASGEWVDTREKADTTQSNKYTSEDFYFENFNLNRTGYEYDNGLKGYVGIDVQGSSTGNVSNGVSANGSECRNKIVEWAKKTRKEHLEGKAQYSHSNQTYDPDDLHYYKGTLAGCTNPIVYDCSSLSSTCYKYAGLTSLYRKVCSGGTIMQEICNNGGEMWLADAVGMTKALPGDCIVRCKNKHKPTQSEMDKKEQLGIEHIMIYIGDGKIIHASDTKNPPNGIREDEWNSDHWSWGRSFFIRPKDLIEADSVSDSNSGTGVIEKNGTVDGNSYVCTLEKCRLTAYGTWDGSTNTTATGKKLSTNANNIVAAHNMPYGTKIYIPMLKGVVNNTGIFTVEDTGGCCFDFDVCVSSSSIGSKFSSKSTKVYVLSWGSGSIASSFTKAVKAQGGIDKYKTAWNNFKKTGGSTMNLLKFSKEDLNIKNQSWY